MALPTALFAMIASFALASAAVLSSVDAQYGTKRDRDSKNAIAAADAGASVALLRLNRFQGGLTEATPCIGPGGEGLQETSPGSGWCPSTSAESVGGAAFSYTVSAFAEDSPLSVVSVGSAGDVSRRIEVGLATHSGENVFGDEQLIGQDNIVLEGTAVEIETNIGTNGDVESNAHGTICGNLRHGTGKSYPEGQPKCGGEVTEGNINLPPIVPPEDLATSNSNCRLVPNCTGPEPSSEVDSYTKQRTSKNPWEAASRDINVGANATLTINGSDYFVCKLDINSGQLIMAAGAHSRIFVDTPENCGLEVGATQVEMQGNASITSTGYNPDEGSFDVLEIYVLGESTVKLGGTADSDELLLYAPESAVEIGGNATWTGLIAGKSMRLHGDPKIKKFPGPPPEGLTLTSLWERTHFVECTGAAASPPDASC